MNIYHFLESSKFIEIKDCTFKMGVGDDSIKSLLHRSLDIKKTYIYNSYPEHSVNINHVQISKHLVSRSFFEKFINDTCYITEAEKEGWGWTWENGWTKKNKVFWKSPFDNDSDEIYNKNNDIMPVLQVSWNDACRFCEWLSLKSGYSVRLPYEKEWEKFATILNIEGIDNAAQNIKNNKIEYSNEFIKKLLNETIKNPSIHLPGMIWEWSNDWFDAYPEGIANKEFGKIYRVLRGGSLLSHPIQKSKQYRFRRCPTARSPFYGFRITLT